MESVVKRVRKRMASVSEAHPCQLPVLCLAGIKEGLEEVLRGGIGSVGQVLSPLKNKLRPPHLMVVSYNEGPTIPLMRLRD